MKYARCEHGYAQDAFGKCSICNGGADDELQLWKSRAFNAWADLDRLKHETEGLDPGYLSRIEDALRIERANLDACIQARETAVTDRRRAVEQRDKAWAERDELAGRLRLACEPCAECGHIDWRELDGCLPVPAPAQVSMYEVVHEWLAENMPRALELCPYKAALSSEAGNPLTPEWTCPGCGWCAPAYDSPRPGGPVPEREGVE